MSGIDLARAFYFDAVRPILDRRFAHVVHSAGLLGYSSEVLGFDDARSRDHNWGPRVRLLLDESHLAREAEIKTVLSDELPVSFAGLPTNFGTGDAAWHLVEVEVGPVNHHVEIFEPGAFFRYHLGFDPREPITAHSWLSVPTQRLLEMTAGAVFHDGVDVLHRARSSLAWYPQDVWAYVLACQWQRISQEEAFVGRTREAGDELGSRVVAARLVRDVIRLWFLLERRYPPYSKWLGTAFTRLSPPAELVSALTSSVSSSDADVRESSLARAYEIAGSRTNSLGLTEAVDPARRTYHGRPYPVVHAERFAAALRTAIADATLRERPLTGNIDQVVDNTDVLSDADAFRQVLPWSVASP
jgi:hypothetical protein